MPANETLEQAVDQEIIRRNNRLLKGLNCYFTSEQATSQSAFDVIWQCGGTRLLDYGTPENEVAKADLLFIPSLINRYYVLDLNKKTSFVHFLKAQGYRVLVMDWGNPTADEQLFDCSAYITQRILPAIDFIKSNSTEKLILAGYCMGGMLALAAAQFTTDKLAGLALFATPWDFQAEGFPKLQLDAHTLVQFATLIQSQPIIAGETVQALFYMTNPWSFARKFSRLSSLPPESEEAQELIAIERWVNDTVDMTSAVAKECWVDWAHNNAPLNGNWQCKEKTIQPETLELPIFVACPLHDAVVPPSSTTPLLQKLKHLTICRPDAGHVSMIASSTARKELWQPFESWLKTSFT